MSWDRFERAAEKGPWAITWRVILFVAGVGFFIGIIAFLVNPLIQGGRIVEKTIDADNVLYNYEWFKQQWRDVQAIEDKIKTQDMALVAFREDLGPRSEWGWEDKQEYDRLNSVRIGLEQQREDVVAKYNARSAMANRNIFKGGDCPETIQ
jgi:hypothetical protein